MALKWTCKYSINMNEKLTCFLENNKADMSEVRMKITSVIVVTVIPIYGLYSSATIYLKLVHFATLGLHGLKQP